MVKSTLPVLRFRCCASEGVPVTVVRDGRSGDHEHQQQPGHRLITVEAMPPQKIHSACRSALD
jgi:hypothetical protein